MKYERPEGTDRFFRELEQRIETIPGVRSAGVLWPLPLASRNWWNQYVAGAIDVGERAYAEYRLATPKLFDTLRVAVLDGRSFLPGDRREVVMVSRKLAERAWPGRSAIGRSLRANPWGGGLETFEVVGVVDDVRYVDLREEPSETIYFDSRGWSWTDWEVSFVVRYADFQTAKNPSPPRRKGIIKLC